MKFPFFCCAFWKPKPYLGFEGGYGFWFRIKGYGLHCTNNPPLFSERYGYKKRCKLPFGFRMKVLKPKE